MYNILIRHAWHYSEQYNKIVEWLNSYSFIEWKNYSVPKENPLHSRNNTELKNDLTNQMRPASCVIILSGMYAAYSDWIEYELNEAYRMGKYIIAVEPWGQQRMPKIIQDKASITVGWNSASVISAVIKSQ